MAPKQCQEKFNTKNNKILLIKENNYLKSKKEAATLLGIIDYFGTKDLTIALQVDIQNDV
jgi:hypothetical protein